MLATRPVYSETKVTAWLGTRAVAWVTALFAIATVGVVWAMASILARQSVPWMAIPMAAAAVMASRSTGLDSRLSRAVAAGLFAAGGTSYAHALAATDRLARILGRGFFETAIAAGPEMIAALVMARLGVLGLALVLAGPMSAAIWSFCWPGRLQAAPVAARSQRLHQA